MLMAGSSAAAAECPRRRAVAAALLRSTPARALGTALGLLLLVRAVNVPAAARQLADVSPGWVAAGVVERTPQTPVGEMPVFGAMPTTRRQCDSGEAWTDRLSWQRKSVSS